jgi:hypothetical protein
MKASIDYQHTLLNEVKDIPQDLLPNLLEIVRLFKQSILSQQAKKWDDLRQEFNEWDQLSDEALINFEKDL